MITDNAYATILLCSYLDTKTTNYKPYTALQWSKLVSMIINSSIKEPAALLNMSQEDISKNLDVAMNEAARISNLLSRGGNMAFALEDLERKGINVITRSDKHYPNRLKSLLKKNAPPILYYCGDISIANQKGIAIVGSRNIDDDAEKFAQELARKAADENLVIYSGGARGIDVISENAALNSGGKVVSVLADSLVKKIKKKDIRNRITNGQLLLLSAINPDAPFSAGSAMNRNKYVYSLSQGAFIIASNYNKGGTWAGATENIENEWVNSFVWNTMNYKGNSELIKKGAEPIDSLVNISIDLLIGEKKSKLEQLELFKSDYDYPRNKNISLLKENSGEN